MTKWEQFEEYLWERALMGEDFNQAAFKEDWGLTGAQATSFIQCYLDAQVRPDAKTLFVLNRVAGTRTTNAMWHIGNRAKDARGVGRQWADDAKQRVTRYSVPTLARIEQQNPRALPAAKALLKGIEASLDMMAAMLDGEA